MIRKFALLALLGLSSPTHAENAWRVDPDFAKKSARKDISGAACGPDRCFAVNDETHYIQRFKIDGQRIKPGKRLRLLDKGEEIDAEAITYDDGIFTVAGSHGLSRKKARFKPAPFTVFRVKGDQITTSTRLREAIRHAEPLGIYAEKPLNKNGVNIEGLAAVGDALYFGFRGPSVQGEGYILQVSAEALFSADKPLTTVIHALPLGDRIGIRDMARVEDGVLLLTGPVNTLPRRYEVWLWTPDSTAPERLTKLPLQPRGKPEGLLVLDEDRNGYSLLIFQDGARNGAPFQIGVAKR